MGYLDTFTNSLISPQKEEEEEKKTLVLTMDLFGNSETEEKRIFTPEIPPYDCRLCNQLYHTDDCTEKDNGQITPI